MNFIGVIAASVTSLLFAMTTFIFSSYQTFGWFVGDQ